ncbi:MAG: Flp family type IVb pilin [Alphaproteobacteria bacterium]|nr:Flp family type IVb pilin [Alphaproteobacteria bacterium]
MWTRSLRRLIDDAAGGVAIEYAMLAMAIGIAAIAALSQIGTKVSNNLSNAALGIG